MDNSDGELAISGAEAKVEDKFDLQSKRKMTITGAVMILCIAGFILKIWNVGIIALLGASILITTKCIDFKTAMAKMDWNTLIILGAAQGFAQGLNVSGGGKLIAEFAVNAFGGQNASPYALMIVGIVIATILTNFMSNTAVLAMLTPIFINIGFSLGLHPEPFVLAIIIGGSTALATPIGTPAVTQTLVAGYRYMDYVKIGLPITIILTIISIILVPMVYGFTPL